MTRLTNYIADCVIEAAVNKSGIDEKLQQLEPLYYELAEAIRVDSLGGPKVAAELEEIDARIAAISKKMKHANSLEALRKDYEIFRANLGGMRVQISFSGSRDDKRIVAGGCTYPADHKFTLRFQELESKKEELVNSKADLRQQVRAVVKSCSTVKKLLEVWPEAKELLPETLVEARPQLPAVQTDQLNKLIGLPSDQA